MSELRKEIRHWISVASFCADRFEGGREGRGGRRGSGTVACCHQTIVQPQSSRPSRQSGSEYRFFLGAAVVVTPVKFNDLRLRPSAPLTSSLIL